MSVRRGRFDIAAAEIRNAEKGEELARDPIRLVMQKCIVYRAEMRYDKCSVEYRAFSEDFDEISEAEVVPRYIWTVEAILDEVTKERSFKVRCVRMGE
jgi:hypothetical protein